MKERRGEGNQVRKGQADILGEKGLQEAGRGEKGGFGKEGNERGEL